MQVKMFRADKMEDLEAKVNAWLNEHGAKIDIEHAQTISGSEIRDDAKQSTLRYQHLVLRHREGVEEAPGRVVLTQVLGRSGACGGSFICLDERYSVPALME